MVSEANEEISRLRSKIDQLEGQLTFFATQLARLMAVASTRSYREEDVIEAVDTFLKSEESNFSDAWKSGFQDASALLANWLNWPDQNTRGVPGRAVEDV